MYRKSMVVLLLIQIMFLAGYGCLLLSNINDGDKVRTVYEIRLNQIVLANKQNSVVEIGKRTNSRQRVVTYDVLVRETDVRQSTLTKADYENLLRIVEAEASGEDENGKLLVANVVLNRVNNEKFPDTITDVVFQKSHGVTQFSPVANGRFWKVDISEDTVAAVDRALAGEDISQGALYFAARKYADPKNMKWFDESLNYLFTHGGHEFFTE